MSKQKLAAAFGFLILFTLYHAAEYMILFKSSSIGFLLFQLLFFCAAWLIAKVQYGQGFGAWGLDFKKGFFRHLIVGMVMGIILYGLTFLISLATGSERVNELPSMTESVAPLSLFIFGSFFSSFSEDVLTRGYVHYHLKERISGWCIVLISATIYLLNHIYRLDDGVEAYTYLFALGILYVIPLVLTGRLWITGGMHWAGNIIFYLTHDVVKTESLEGPVSPNYILAVMAIVFISLNYFLLTKRKLSKVV